MVQLLYLDVKYNKKGTVEIFRGYKATNKVRLKYAELKKQQVRYDCGVYRLTGNKQGTNNAFRG